jgi:hypothetical protein
VHPHGFVTGQLHGGTIFDCARNRVRRDGEKNKHDCLHDLKCESGLSAHNSVAPTAPYHCEPEATPQDSRDQDANSAESAIHG